MALALERICEECSREACVCASFISFLDEQWLRTATQITFRDCEDQAHVDDCFNVRTIKLYYVDTATTMCCSRKPSEAFLEYVRDDFGMTLL